MNEIKDSREDLINDICQYVMTLTDDLSQTKSMLYMIMDKYEITDRCTELVTADENRNDNLLKRFIIAKKVKGCTDRTLKYYVTELKKILRVIGKTVDDITAEDIRYYMAMRQIHDGVSNVTIGGEIRALGSFFQWLLVEEHITKNPMLKIDRIKINKSPKKAFTEMEVEKLRRGARDDREGFLIEFLLSTGCRVTETSLVKLSEIQGDKILVHGKGQKDRYVYLNTKAQLAMEIYMSQRKDTNPYLFPGGRFGTVEGCSRKETIGWWKCPEYITEDHITTSSIESVTRKLAKRAGVERANPHKFRRTCATQALRHGMPIEQVSRMLGHSSVETTQIYLDITEEDFALAHKKYVI